MLLEIITPDREVYKGEVDAATFPGSKGRFQVLRNHAPLISALEAGSLVYEDKDGRHELNVDGGVVEVLNNQISVLAEAATPV